MKSLREYIIEARRDLFAGMNKPGWRGPLTGRSLADIKAGKSGVRKPKNKRPSKEARKEMQDFYQKHFNREWS